MPRAVATFFAALLAASASVGILAADVPIAYYEPRSLAADDDLHVALVRALRRSQVDPEIRTILRPGCFGGCSNGKKAASKQKEEAAQAAAEHAHLAKLSEETSKLVLEHADRGNRHVLNELGDLKKAQQYHEEQAAKETSRSHADSRTGRSGRRH